MELSACYAYSPVYNFLHKLCNDFYYFNSYINYCRHGLCVAALTSDGPLYAVGGHDGWSFLNSVERWDPESRKWNFAANMISPRSTAGLAALRMYSSSQGLTSSEYVDCDHGIPS